MVIIVSLISTSTMREIQKRILRNNLKSIVGIAATAGLFLSMAAFLIVVCVTVPVHIADHYELAGWYWYVVLFFWWMIAGFTIWFSPIGRVYWKLRDMVEEWVGPDRN
jgi:hypothetical protein